MLCGDIEQHQWPRIGEGGDVYQNKAAALHRIWMWMKNKTACRHTVMYGGVVWVLTGKQHPCKVSLQHQVLCTMLTCWPIMACCIECRLTSALSGLSSSPPQDTTCPTAASTHSHHHHREPGCASLEQNQAGQDCENGQYTAPLPCGGGA